MDAKDVIASLGLEPHPEGGHYREVFRNPSATNIYYLLKVGELSAWHRIASVEIWPLVADRLHGGPGFSV